MEVLYHMFSHRNPGHISLHRYYIGYMVGTTNKSLPEMELSNSNGIVHEINHPFWGTPPWLWKPHRLIRPEVDFLLRAEPWVDIR